ncbi:MAG: secretin and TonB N-terminal domain-containing protein [Burkholderiales bacterium]|jgi:general secretion pathway protein D|nr:secretin and TonB N-terminal domain-containing protein [Burkholderiales bacterium]
MKMTNAQSLIKNVLISIAAALMLAGCETNLILKESRDHFDSGRGEEGLMVLEKASRDNPGNLAYRSEYFRQRELAIAQWLSQAETLRQAGQHDSATAIYRVILKYDPQNVRAQTGIAGLETDKSHRVAIANAEKLIKENKFIEARDALRPVFNENPTHRDARRLQREIDDKTLKPAIITPQIKATTAKPITLELREVSLRSVFDVISRTTGLSFVFDKDFRGDQRTTITVRNATVDELLGLVLSTNQLEQKFVNENTLMIYPNTPQKQREYQELVIRTFYLKNVPAKQTASMIRTLVKTRDIFIDDTLNMLVIKDTPNAIRMAEKLVAAHDLAEPEVMLEVEVLEIGSNRLLDLGLRYPDSVAWSLVGGATTPGGGSIGTPGVLSLTEWLNRNAGLVRLTVTNPLFLFSLRQQDGVTSVLANPRIRVKNREKAKIHIGDRVPVITTTAAAAGGFVSESVSYLDVGLKLEVEPLVYLQDEIGIKVGLEVSNIVREIRSTNSNTLTYQVGTRNAQTNLRLKDGETQILAGLISSEDRRTANRVPGIGALPVVGRLFSDTHETRGKTEIVLLITPRLLRTLDRPDNRVVEFSAGTEASSGTLSVSAATPVTQPSPPIAVPTAPKPTPAPAVQPAPTPGQQSPPPAIPALVPFGGLQPSP